jgi:hypothetical protein
MSVLSRKEVEKIVERVKNEASKPQCLTCDCFQGFLVQLEMDCPQDVGDIVNPLKVPKEKMHGCLGCVPCPAGELFSEYIRKNSYRKD